MRYLIVLFIFVCSVHVHAQKVTGYWYGQANVQMSGIQNNYLTELIISQKGTKVKGFFGYYFKDVYQSFVVKGTYDPQSKKIVIHDIPIIYFRTNSTMNSVDCITSFYGTLRISKVKSELTGFFYRDKKYTYTCPDLRVSYTLYKEARVEDSIFKDMAATRSFWKPQPPAPDVVMGNAASRENEMAMPAEKNAPLTGTKPQTAPAAPIAIVKKPVPANSNTSANAKTAAPSATNTEKKNVATTPEKNNSTESKPATAGAVAKLPVQPVDVQSAVPIDIIKIKEDFKKRKQIVSKQIEVSSDSVRLSFYDNGDIDGDSISVFLNGKLVVAHQDLSERAFNVYIQLDSLLDVNEVSMFAENLGKYPPNTALMVISDGDKRFETFLSSDFKGNATIRLKLRRNSVAGNQ